jgi:hypothetical protein
MRRSRPKMDPAEYDIGYGKPPVASRFKPGQSGNPKGRDKAVKNIRTIVEAEGAARVKIVEGGRTRWVTKLEAAIMRLHAKALSGETRAIEKLIELNIRISGLGAERDDDGDDLSTDDQAIYDALMGQRDGGGR